MCWKTQQKTYLILSSVWTLLVPNILVLASLESETKSVLQQNLLESQTNSEVQQDVVASFKGQTEKTKSLPNLHMGLEIGETELKREENLESRGWKQRRKRAIQKFQPKPPTLVLTKYANKSSSYYLCHHNLDRYWRLTKISIINPITFLVLTQYIL